MEKHHGGDTSGSRQHQSVNSCGGGGVCAHFLHLLAYLRFLGPQLEPQLRHGELQLSVAPVQQQQLLLQLGKSRNTTLMWTAVLCLLLEARFHTHTPAGCALFSC